MGERLRSSNGIYEMTSENKPEIIYTSSQDIVGDPYINESPKYISQLFSYVKDARKVLMGRVHPNNMMSLVSLMNFPKDK